jgi:hypothetical protein
MVASAFSDESQEGYRTDVLSGSSVRELLKRTKYLAVLTNHVVLTRLDPGRSQNKVAMHVVIHSQLSGERRGRAQRSGVVCAPLMSRISQLVFRIG